MEGKKTILLANFGGPRSLEEIEPFLTELLTDKEVIRTPLPQWLHKRVFSSVAKKRAKTVTQDYAAIGGKSPIFEDTQAIAERLSEITAIPTYAFHRYLPETHSLFTATLSQMEEDITVFPLFPQFSFATTGSIAKWFYDHLPKAVVEKMQWIRSYCTHPAFIACCQKLLRSYLEQQGVREDEALILFSAHSLPQTFIDTGDVYESQCELSCHAIAKAFPRAKTLLTYQSKFGKGKWLEPSTLDVCEHIFAYNEGRAHVLLFPLSFVSDHFETLFEIEKLYLPILKGKGLFGHRVPALNRDEAWVRAIAQIIDESVGETTVNCLRKAPLYPARS